MFAPAAEALEAVRDRLRASIGTARKLKLHHFELYAKDPDNCPRYVKEALASYLLADIITEGD